MKLLAYFGGIVLALVLAGCGMTDSSQNMRNAYEAAKKGDWETVKVAAEKRWREVPTDNDAAVLLSLALFYTERDNDESMNRAINCIRQAVTALPDRYDVAYIYGWMLMSMNRFPQANAPLTKAYELHMKDRNSIGQETQGAIKYALGMCCLRNNTFDKAENYLSQATRSTPYSSWSRLYSDIACALVYSHKYTEALNFLNKAMTVENRRAELRKAKMAELKEMKAKAAAPNVIEKKQREIDELAEDECYYITILNMAIVCDYLSYPQFNSQNPDAFRNSVPQWYNYAKQQIQVVRGKTVNAKQQVELDRTIARIDKRLVAISGK